MPRATVRTAAVRTVAAVATATSLIALAGCSPTSADRSEFAGIVPAPARFELTDRGDFTLGEGTRFVVSGDDAAAVAETFAAPLRAATGYDLPVEEGEPAASDISLVIDPEIDGAEAYTLESGADGVRIAASAPAGLFWGTQSLRQMLPGEIEAEDADEPAGGWRVPAASIADEPRFAYRASLVDVARHFFPVEYLEQHLDRMALLKLNVLHLHLTDDQGWRIQIDSWPELTGIGASTSVGGDGGGFYTKDDYRRIVEYAAERFITVVPEIDLPGHTNAALSAYPELNCDGVAPAPYEGVEVGFSSLCADPARAEATDRFLADVLGEVAEMTPGPWIHVGGDEPLATQHDDFLDLVARITAAGAATGKTVIAYHEMGASNELPPGTIGHYWDLTAGHEMPANRRDEPARPYPTSAGEARSFLEQGGKLVLAAADKTYLDMMYPDRPAGPLGTELGTRWAATITLEEAYDWRPEETVDGLSESDILGVAASVWTETLSNPADFEFMVFPRIAAIAEVGWSPADARDEAGFRSRLPVLGAHLDRLGVSYRKVGGVDWTG
ncbi:beta-N-acetylhexosaminidase [Agromyces endophyticus]|uniref:beta-N-acetylhexosaminidase n=1 Tax=Agromyces sp. H17E-10 TaxID=2932244 RepID=UPI001FD03760|nr:beta-N-acetylhexosaminidase [Agromyces sp. H17E-10]UOQ88367.1 beta-N-acetylhexosaminidase [Agromyces sp. H17E-10]